MSKYYLGIFEGHYDPAVAIAADGRLLAYSEEERHLRFKHAARIYPSRALQYCLKVAGVKISDISAVGVNWDCLAYSDGRMKAFFEGMRQQYPVDSRTIGWQNWSLNQFSMESQKQRHEFHWRKLFGDVPFPPIHPVAHHYLHAFQSYMQSGFDRAVAVTVDGSGDDACTVLWKCEGNTITQLRRIVMPHSLGWVYAAFTEYLGFEAYDGEYKVMGLAAYGRPNAELWAKVDQIVQVAPDGIEYRIDPVYVHYGAHSYSDRFTDSLPDLFGRKPRLPSETIDAWHEDVAFAVQESLEDHIERMVDWAIQETGFSKVCIGGGVGLNIKMNSRLFHHAGIQDVFGHPLCSDGGAAQGSALAACYELSGHRPERLETLAVGLEQSDAEIEAVLKQTGVHYERPDDICAAVAKELANKRIAGWFQGRMEAGPRALGHRSILADPRDVANRDKVNAIIKFREYWRPFCPSMVAESAADYLESHTYAPFMILAFRATERLKREAPAVVHVDGTARVQLVHQNVEPLFHRLLESFRAETGVPVLLNTSFNIKGEPIVCTIHDALRTFWATGLEVLAAGSFLIRKPSAPPL